jgi:SAM-dependent methyltransferase
LPGALQFDEERSRAVEAVYATADVVEQRRRFLGLIDLQPGERVLDLGCGPGYLASEMAAAVGAAGFVRGVDISPSMLELASRRDHAEEAAPVELTLGDVCSIDAPDGSFDVAVSTQVYEYVEDIPAALREVHRLLVPGGRVAILDTEWDSVVWRSSDDDRMRRVLEAWDEHLVQRDLPRRLPELLTSAGFTPRTNAVVPLLNVGYDPATFSAGILEVIAEYVAGHRDITDAEAAAWAADLRGLAQSYFFSLNRYVFVATR